MAERLRLVEDWASGECNVAELCRLYGVARGTGYKWINRYEACGVDGLTDLSRAPHEHPNAIGQEMEDLVIGVREKHPSWGAGKIRARLRRDHADKTIPAESTVGAILKRHGLTVARKRRPCGRRPSDPLAAATEANRVWSVDYKGWFPAGDGEVIYRLTISDNYSRFLLRCQVLRVADYAHTKPVMEAAFREYGMPERMRSDNGPPFGSNGASGLTGFSVWLIKVGIVPEHIERGKPEQNGRHERMHRTLKEETASPPAANPRAQQERFDQFRAEYNQERPHEALGMDTPAEHYVASERCYPDRVREVDYPGEFEVRQVSPGGQMRWKNQKIFVAKALEGERVGLEQIDDQLWRVWFSFYEVGVMDSRAGTIRPPAEPSAPAG